MKKIIVIIICFLLTLTLTGCKKDNLVNKDALKFKKEYERLNTSDGYVKVSLSENNYFKYITNKQLVKILKDKSALVFIGTPSDNESRDIVNVLSYVNASSIFYIDINKVEDDAKKTLNDAGISLNKAVVFGVLKGEIINYQEGTGYDSSPLTEDEKSELKLIYDNINAKVSDDACDIESLEDC